MLKEKQRRKNYRKPTLLILAVLGFIIGIGVIAKYVYDQRHTVTQPTASQSTKGEVDSVPDASTDDSENIPAASDTNSSSASQSADTKNNGSATNAALLEPSGNFVSAHRITMSTAITSVCNTTPGASCKIMFTSGGTTKSVGVQVTDRGGSTYWNSWTPKSIGLSPGSWKITATASLNGQDKTASDATNMEISE